jgi:hypothetical protein
MARTLSWRHRLPEITHRVQNSAIETWTRTDLESVFEIKRASAQLLMKAVGEIHNLGGKHVIDRLSLLEFLKALAEADNPESGRRERLLRAEAVPHSRSIKVSLPEELRTVMVRHLPPEISLEEGRLGITGRNAREILDRLVLLSRALQNDLDTALQLLDPPPVVPQVDDQELRALFTDLRRHEIAKNGKSESCMHFASKP